jgi:hypothetical protein
MKLEDSLGPGHLHRTTLPASTGHQSQFQGEVGLWGLQCSLQSFVSSSLLRILFMSIP